jgi:lysophospholipase L1-like esterase
MLLNIGVRTVEETDLGFVEMSVERLLLQVRESYPGIQLIWHTIPASLDERRIKLDLSKNQLDEKIRVHNRVHTEVCRRLNVPIFDMHGLTALVDPELTWDGLHFAVGTGVSEALANVLFNLVCF